MLDAHRIQLAKEHSVTLTIRARPNARTTKITGMLEDGSLKIDIHAAPEDGEANEELVRFLAEAFDIAKSHIELLSGHTGRLKVVRINRA
jgi:uncharacterized protein